MKIPSSLMQHAQAIENQRARTRADQPPANGSQITLNRLTVFVIDPFEKTVTAQQIQLSPEGLNQALGYRDPVHNATLGEIDGQLITAACRQRHDSLAIYYPLGTLPAGWTIRGCNVTLMDKAVLYAKDPRRGIVSVISRPSEIAERITWEI